MLYPEIKLLPFGPRIISKLHERYQEFTILVTKYYGWESFQETLPYFRLNNIKNNIMNNSNIRNNQYNSLFSQNKNNLNPFMNKNINENIRNNTTNNNQDFSNYQMTSNNCINFKKNSNIGNINFFQMNSYMIPNNTDNFSNKNLE